VQTCNWDLFYWIKLPFSKLLLIICCHSNCQNAEIPNEQNDKIYWTLKQSHGNNFAYLIIWWVIEFDGYPNPKHTHRKYIFVVRVLCQQILITAPKFLSIILRENKFYLGLPHGFVPKIFSLVLTPPTTALLNPVYDNHYSIN
jgi:hypothetical protein